MSISILKLFFVNSANEHIDVVGIQKRGNMAKGKISKNPVVLDWNERHKYEFIF